MPIDSNEKVLNKEQENNQREPESENELKTYK